MVHLVDGPLNIFETGWIHFMIQAYMYEEMREYIRIQYMYNIIYKVRYMKYI